MKAKIDDHTEKGQHQPINDVEHYARQLCITSNYLNKIDRQSLSVTAKQYICQKLLEEAKRLLAYTNLSITEIAAKLHFDTASYFVRQLRKYIGITPLHTGKTHGIRKSDIFPRICATRFWTKQANFAPT